MTRDIERLSEFPRIWVCVTSISSHGTHMLTVLLGHGISFTCLDRESMWRYQWVDGSFVRYYDQPPRVLPECPSDPHKHTDGFFEKVYLATWQRASRPAPRPYCNCSPYYEDGSYEHLSPSRCHALRIAAVVADWLKEGKNLDDLSLDEHLLAMPSTSKRQVSNFPRSRQLQPSQTGNSIVRKAVSSWKN